MNELANFFFSLCLKTAMMAMAISSTQTDSAARDNTVQRMMRIMSTSAGGSSEIPSVTEQRKEENTYSSIHVYINYPVPSFHKHTHPKQK